MEFLNEQKIYFSTYIVLGFCIYVYIIYNRVNTLFIVKTSMKFDKDIQIEIHTKIYIYILNILNYI